MPPSPCAILRTVDLASVTRVAEVLVVAAGRAGLIGPGHVAVGATVIDVVTGLITWFLLTGRSDLAAPRIREHE